MHWSRLVWTMKELEFPCWTNFFVETNSSIAWTFKTTFKEECCLPATDPVNAPFITWLTKRIAKLQHQSAFLRFAYILLVCWSSVWVGFSPWRDSVVKNLPATLRSGKNKQRTGLFAQVENTNVFNLAPWSSALCSHCSTPGRARGWNNSAAS